MINLLRNTISSFRALFGNAAANAFIQATGLTGSVQKAAITQLCIDLQASGLWSKMKAVYPMVTDNYNLLSYTEDFTNAAWNKFNSTVSGNTTTSPIGTLTADSFNDGVLNAQHQVYAQINSLPIGTYTFSIYLKQNTNTKNIAFYPFGTSSTGGTGSGGVILTQSGTFVANIGGGVVSYGSQDVGNGWRRFYVVGTSTAISNIYPAIAYVDGTNVSYAGTNTDSYIWGAQFELGSVPSTYQPILTTPSAFMASQMKYNLKDARDLDAAFRLTWSGGWSYSATGATPNGTNAYADTKLNSSTQLSLNSTHISVYLRTNNDNATSDIGNLEGATSGINIFPRLSNLMYARINDQDANAISNTSSAKYIIASRTSSVNKNIYINGTKNTITSTSVSLTNNSLYLGAINDLALGARYFSNRENAFATIGNGLSDTDALLLNQIVEKYQVALSRGVQAAQSFYYNSAYSNEANTYLYSTQITGTTQVSAINTLINGLKANNLWSKMKAVYPFVTDYRNLLSYTEDFGTGWTQTNATVTVNTTTAPNGTLTADTIATNSGGYVSLNFSNNGITQTFSCYAKKKTNSITFFGVYDSTDKGIWFNFDTGVITQTIGTISNQNSENVGNGWYRLSFTFTNTASSTTYGVPYATTASGSFTRGTDVYTWGAQLENGSTLTTYQPVLGAQQSTIAAQMKFNLVNPQDSDAAFRLAFSGGWTYSTNGAQPNGTNGYADTKFSPSANMTLNSSHLSLYSRTSIGNLPQSDMGSYTVAATDALTLAIAYNNVCYMGSYAFGMAVNYIDFANTDSKGYYINTRTSSTLLKGFKNNVVGDTSTTSVTGTLPSLNTYIGAENFNLTPTSYSTKQYAFATMGAGLSDAEVAILTQLVIDFQTTLSRNI